VSALPDAALPRLARALRAPDLSGTRYVLGREVGRGGMGSVWEADDTVLGRSVAVKVLDLPDEAGDLAARLEREARVLARLEHPGIVPVSLPERLRLFLRVCETVAFAHARGVLHRDLKPGNVMVGPFGEVLVLDWGIARLVGEPEPPGARRPGSAAPGAEPRPDEAPATAAGTVLGTPGFMAPEQERGEAGVDLRADVFSLGALLAVLAREDAGRNRRLAAIVARATAERPGERYGDVPSLAADVARFLDGEPVSAYRERAWERAARFAGRHRVAILLVLAYLVARAAILLVYRR